MDELLARVRQRMAAIRLEISELDTFIRQAETLSIPETKRARVIGTALSLIARNGSTTTRDVIKALELSGMPFDKTGLQLRRTVSTYFSACGQFQNDRTKGMWRLKHES